MGKQMKSFRSGNGKRQEPEKTRSGEPMPVPGVTEGDLPAQEAAEEFVSESAPLEETPPGAREAARHRKKRQKRSDREERRADERKKAPI